MATIFVAYGGPDRERVLDFAAEQAAASGYDLFVYHAQESADESSEAVRAEIGRVLDETAPGVDAELHVAERAEVSEDTNVSVQQQLVDALLESDREFEYAVMGDIERGSVGELMHASLTRAVLATHAVPVLLVPV